MNRTEAAYSSHLDNLKAMGQVADWKFDRIKLRLAKLCYLTVDFAVMMMDGTIEFHDVKGGPMEDDAVVKMKVVAEEFWWFRFFIVRQKPKRDGGGWMVREVGE